MQYTSRLMRIRVIPSTSKPTYELSNATAQLLSTNAIWSFTEAEKRYIQSSYANYISPFIFNPFADDDDDYPPSLSPHSSNASGSPKSASSLPSLFKTNFDPLGNLNVDASKGSPDYYKLGASNGQAMHPRIIPHIIGEDDPFNPFSTTLFDVGDSTARSIMTPGGKIVAPIPTRPMAAAIASFELAALAQSEGVV